jgi:hypothetical protein
MLNGKPCPDCGKVHTREELDNRIAQLQITMLGKDLFKTLSHEAMEMGAPPQIAVAALGRVVAAMFAAMPMSPDERAASMFAWFETVKANQAEIQGELDAARAAVTEQLAKGESPIATLIEQFRKMFSVKKES